MFIHRQCDVNGRRGRTQNNSSTMAVYQSPNCGENRVYVFRPMKEQSFKFRVKALNNVSLCLSGTSTEVPHRMYEIFLAGWGGAESAIRRNKKEDVCKIKTPNLLSPNEFRGFWIVVTSNSIKVGREGEPTPFMVHVEPLRNIVVTHYGYCTAYGATGSWTFADDNPTYYGQQFDMSGLFGALNQKPQPIPPPVLGFVPPTCGGGAATVVSQNRILKWVACCNGSKCPAPVQVSKRNKQPLVVTARHKGGVMPGVFLPGNNTCYIPWGGQAIAKNNYFLLSNPGGAEFTWVSAKNGAVPVGALEGGYSETGEKLFIGRFTVGDSLTSGKVHPSHNTCSVPYWGEEHSSRNYEVLCLKTIPLSMLGIQ